MASRKEPLDAPMIDVLYPFIDKLPFGVVAEPEPEPLRGEPNESTSGDVLEMAIGAGMVEIVLDDRDEPADGPAKLS